MGYIAVDLDGTLAEYRGWNGPTHIGAPIPAMVDRVKTWLWEAKDVRIFTARVASTNIAREESIPIIQAWCLEHIGCFLPVTAEKDHHMVELWDDRCVSVEKNTGRILTEGVSG